MSTNETPDAPHRAIASEQYSAARLAGFMYLASYVTAMFGYLQPLSIIGSGDFAQKAQRVAASERLYRFALTSMAISWIVIVVLAFALYVTLESVNRRLAQIALCFELGQAFIGAVTIIFSLAVLGFYINAHACGPSQIGQWQTLVRVVGRASASGFNIAMAFFGPGSFLFFYLFYRSRFFPKILAVIGMLGSFLMLVVSLGALIVPEYEYTFKYAAWAPIGIAEVGTALWLMIAGIRAPKEQA